MPTSTDQHVFRNARVFSLLTLISRVLGLARDALLARLLGVSALGTAWSIAFQFPNTFRRLFGEGALSAAFIPEYAQLTKHDAALADRFASLVCAVLAAALGLLTVLIELGLAAALLTVSISDTGRRAIQFLMLMLPFMPMVCLTAILGGMLQTHGRFAAQAGAPIILNLCMISAALLGSRALGLSPERAAMCVALSVTVAGVLQSAWCLRDLRGMVRWTRVFDGAIVPARRMLGRMAPIALGLGAVQVSTFIESWVILAWPIYQGPTFFGAAYPLDEAAGAALTNAQRLYQFPLGVFGIALATAAFPALARLADEPRAFAETLRRSIRLAAFIGLPATAGLIWVARDLSAVVYQGGAVSPEGGARIARCLGMYALLVGTYSITHVLTRAFYAVGDTRLPTRVSIFTVVLSLGLSVGLMWPMRESGLALGSSVAAALQLGVLAAAGHRRLTPGIALFDGATMASLARSACASAVMVGLLWILSTLKSATPEVSYGRHAMWLGIDCVAGAAGFGGIAALLCRQEIGWVLGRPRKGSDSGIQAAGD